MTQVRRVDLAATSDLEAEIQNLCTNMAAGGYRLASSFVYPTQLVLIFQKE